MLSCNHLFYYPDQQLYLTPEKMKLTYSEKILHLDQDEVDLTLWVMSRQSEKNANTVVLHFHGNAENMSSHFLFTAWLVKEGFDLVTMDYRGYGKSTGTPSREGLVSDAIATIDWVRAAYPQKRLVVVGQSLGGAVAIPALVRSKSKVDALVIESSFDSYRKIAREKLSNIWLTWPLQWPLSFLVSDSLSPVDDAGKIKIPVLDIHGEEDPVVPIAAGEKLFKALGSKNKEFWKISKAGHTPLVGQPTEPYRQELLNFLMGKS